MSATAPLAPPRARAGAWSLAVVGIVVVWVLVGIVFALIAMSDRAEWAGLAAYIILMGSLLVIPMGLLTSIVLAIVAFARNRPLGKILAGVAMLLVVLVAVVAVSAMLGSEGPLGLLW